MEGVNTNCELKRISPWNKEAQIITITIHPSIFYTHFVLHSGPVNVLFALTFTMCCFILAHIRDTQRNPFSLSCNVCINAYSERIRDQIPANGWWPMDFVYVKRRCCCWQHGQTENLGRWGSLRENKSWATFTGLCAINNGRSLGEPRGTSEPRDLCWCVLRCWWRAWQTVRERGQRGEPVVSLAISPRVAASFSGRRRSGPVQHRDAAIEGNLRSPVSTFCYSTGEHGSTPSLCGFGRRMPLRKNTKRAQTRRSVSFICERQSVGLLFRGQQCSEVEMNPRKRGAWGKGMNHTEKCARTSETAVQHLINAPWRQVLGNMEISQSCQKESYCTHCCPTGWWLFTGSSLFSSCLSGITRLNRLQLVLT